MSSCICIVMGNNKMIADKACWERGCACHDHWANHPGVELMKKDWVGLTDEDRSEIHNRMDWVIDFDWEYELAIEAKLKELNT